MAASVSVLRLVDTVRRALKPCGLSVVRDGEGWAVVSSEDAAIGPRGVALLLDLPGLAYARRLKPAELARWADGWLACWRVWGGGKG